MSNILKNDDLLLDYYFSTGNHNFNLLTSIVSVDGWIALTNSEKYTTTCNLNQKIETDKWASILLPGDGSDYRTYYALYKPSLVLSRMQKLHPYIARLIGWHPFAWQSLSAFYDKHFDAKK